MERIEQSFFPRSPQGGNTLRTLQAGVERCIIATGPALWDDFHSVLTGHFVKAGSLVYAEKRR